MEVKLTDEQLEKYRDLVVKRNDVKINIANTNIIIMQQKKLMEHMTLKAMELDGEIEKLNQELTEQYGQIKGIDISTGVVELNQEA